MNLYFNFNYLGYQDPQSEGVIGPQGEINYGTSSSYQFISELDINANTPHDTGTQSVEDLAAVGYYILNPNAGSQYLENYNQIYYQYNMVPRIIGNQCVVTGPNNPPLRDLEGTKNAALRYLQGFTSSDVYDALEPIINGAQSIPEISSLLGVQSPVWFM